MQKETALRDRVMAVISGGIYDHQSIHYLTRIILSSIRKKSRDPSLER
jgi:hypothetical protein